MSDKQRKCWLQSVNDTYPHIEISGENYTFVGRTRDTALADTMVSKQHLKMIANLDEKSVRFEVLGLNASVLNGKQLEKSNSYTAISDDVIEIIPNKYPYKVHFDTGELAIDRQLKDEKKRKRSVEDEEKSICKKMKWHIDVFVDAKAPFAGDRRWESYNNGQLIVYTMPNCRGSKRIAAYDMDGTLITTKSGKVFPTSVDDWKLAFGTITTMLRAKYSDSYKIVILTNQAGISKGKTKLSEMRKKIEDIAKVIGIPIQAFVATGDNCFRKPMTGMWQALCDHKNDGIRIDLEQSYYVGDAAGRPENKSIKKKKDHSSVDRLLALNLGIPFFTPEEHFMKAQPQKWIPSEFDPKAFLNETISLTETPNARICASDLEVIVMVGGPGSGKSHFCKQHLEPNNYEIVSRDQIGTWQKCVDRVNDCLKAKRKVVVDNTNGDLASRARYLNAAKKNKVPCRCFVMTTTFRHAEHNITYREMTDSKHSKISKIVLNSYKKHYVEPTLEEGFSEIVNVNFVPSFQSEREKGLYEMYLLSS